MAFSRTTALDYLRHAHEQNRLGHAYLISGPPGSGKQQLAADLASLVNGTPATEVFSAKAREIVVALPESLPDTIRSRCIAIPLARDGQIQASEEDKKLVKLLQQISHERIWTVQFAYRLAQEFQRLLRSVREEVKSETDEALKQEQIRYRDTTDGAWLEEREQYYKARAESLYLQRRAELIEALFAWWSDVLRSSNGVAQRNLPGAGEETAVLASRFSTAEILKRIRCLQELRDHLDRNIHEALAIEVAFLTIFTA